MSESGDEAEAPSIFQDFGPYARLRAAAGPVAVPAGFSVETPPPGAWPSEHGAPGRTSRCGEPVVSDRYVPVWSAPLGEAANPRGLLVGGGLVVVNGERARGVFHVDDGRAGGRIPQGGGAGFLDGARRTLLAEASEGGLSTFVLPEGTRDAFVMLARPQPAYSREVLSGPGGVLAMLSVKRSHLGEPPGAFIETFQVADWRAKNELDIAEGLTPLAGLVRVQDGSATFALAPSGPVLVAPEGVRWCDWLLRPLAERAWQTQVQAVSTGDDARVRVACTDGHSCELWLVSPGEAPVQRVSLPWAPEHNWTPPLIAPDGGTILTPSGHVWSVDALGQRRWSAQRDEGEPMGTLSSNGLVLLAGSELCALTAGEGARHVLWKPAERLTTPPILAGGRIYVASSDQLFALEPA